jgi:hypothetical protein
MSLFILYPFIYIYGSLLSVLYIPRYSQYKSTIRINLYFFLCSFFFHSDVAWADIFISGEGAYA